MDTTTVAAKAGGEPYVSFTLSGIGPYAINVQLMGDPSRTASVPIIGSSKRDRQPTIFSRLGSVFAGSLLPGPGEKEVRGIFLEEQGIESSPVRLEWVGARTIRLRAVAVVDALGIQVIDPYSLQSSDGGSPVAIVRRDRLAVDETIEVEHQGPLALVGIAGFVNDEPWEGWAAVVTPHRLQPPRFTCPETRHPARKSQSAWTLVRSRAPFT